MIFSFIFCLLLLHVSDTLPTDGVATDYNENSSNLKKTYNETSTKIFNLSTNESQQSKPVISHRNVDDFWNKPHYYIHNNQLNISITAWGFTETKAKTLALDFLLARRMIKKVIDMNQNFIVKSVFEEYFIMNKLNLAYVSSVLNRIYNDRRNINAIPARFHDYYALTFFKNQNGLIYFNRDLYFESDRYIRASTIIHELSHQFGLEDISLPPDRTEMVYDRELCKQLAKFPESILNADNIAYFVMDTFLKDQNFKKWKLSKGLLKAAKKISPRFEIEEIRSSSNQLDENIFYSSMDKYFSFVTKRKRDEESNDEDEVESKYQQLKK